VSRRKTVLIVDDDPGILHVLADGLANVLDLFDVVTASNGVEAIEELDRQSVDVLVTDLAMPVMDGFSLIAYVTNRRSTLPVVVLSGMVGSMLDQRLAGYGGLRVLRKPISYQDVATCVLEEIERVDRGQVEGIPLAGVLQLIEAERRSCTIVVRSGRRRGQLQFESGRLMNAFSDDFGAEGEAAAYDIMSWPDTSIEFEPLPTNVRRLIHTPMQLMLVELAVAQDQARELEDADPPLAEPPPLDEPTEGPTDEPPPPDEPTEGPTDEPPPPDEPTEDPTDEPTAATLAGGDPGTPTEEDRGAAWPPDEADDPGIVDDTILLDEPRPPAAEDVPDIVTGPSVRPPVAARPEAGAEPRPPSEAAHVAAEVEVSDTHVREMVAAIERLAQRAKAADEALAAVASEVDAFREARRRFDETNAQHERRRHELERFRDEVAHLAREILGRVDGMFDAMTGDPAAGTSGEAGPPT